MSPSEAREKDARIMSAIKDILSDVDHLDIPASCERSRRTQERVFRKTLEIDLDLSEYMQSCHHPGDISVRYNGCEWTAYCEACGRTAAAPTLDELEDRWNAMVDEDREREAGE